MILDQQELPALQEGALDLEVIEADIAGAQEETLPALVDGAPSITVGIAPGTADGRPLLLVRSFLDTGTEYASDIPVRYPDWEYDPTVLQWGTIERSVSIPPGPPIIGAGELMLADTPDTNSVQHLRTILDQRTQIRRLVDFKLGYQGGDEATFPTIYRGEYMPCVFPPDAVRLRFRDIWYRALDRQVPGQWGRDVFPNLPAGRDSFFFPFVFGRHESTEENPQGVLPLVLVDTTTNDYAASQGWVKEILAVYRRLSGETAFTIVDPSEYEPVEEERAISDVLTQHKLGYVRFHEAQPEGAELRCDLDGVSVRGDWGVLTSLNEATIRNPVDHLINLLYVMFTLSPQLTPADYESFRVARDQYETLGLLFDYAITEPMTFRSAMSQLLASAMLHFYQDTAGRMAVKLNAEADPNAPIFTETTDILRFSGKGKSRTELDITPMQPEKTINTFRYKHSKNHITGQWAGADEFINEEDLAELGVTEDEEVDLYAVRDAATAEWSIAQLASYHTLRSYRVELSIPAGGNAHKLELAKPIKISYYGGIGGPWIEEEFIPYTLNFIAAELRYLVRAWRRVSATGVTASIPIELAEAALYADTFDTTYHSTAVSIDPADFGGTRAARAECVIEAVSSSDHEIGNTVQIVDEFGQVYAEFEFTVPIQDFDNPGDQAYDERKEVAFTLNSEARTYAVKMVGSDDPAINTRHVRIFIDLNKARTAAVQIPMIGGDMSTGGGQGTPEDNDGSAYCNLSLTTDYDFGFDESEGISHNGFTVFRKDESKWDRISHWRLAVNAAVFNVAGEPHGSGSAALFRLSDTAMVAGSELTWSENIQPETKEIEIPNNAANFTDGDDFVVLIKASDGNDQGFYIYRADLWVHLTEATKMQVYTKVGNSLGGGSGPGGQFDYTVRTRFELAKWTTGTQFFLESAAVEIGGGAEIRLLDVGEEDSGQTFVEKRPTSNEAVSGAWTNPQLAYEAGNGPIASTLAKTELNVSNATSIRQYGDFGFDAEIPDGVVITDVQLRSIIGRTGQNASQCMLIRRLDTAEDLLNHCFFETESLFLDGNPDLLIVAGRVFDASNDVEWTKERFLNANFAVRVRAVQPNNTTPTKFYWDEVSVRVGWGLDIAALKFSTSTYERQRSSALALTDGRRYVMHYSASTGQTVREHSHSFLVAEINLNAD